MVDLSKHYIQARMTVALPNDKGLMGYGTVIIDDSIAIKNVRVYEGAQGAYLSFPQRRTADGAYEPYVTCPPELMEEIRLAAMLDIAYQQYRQASIADITIKPYNKRGLLAFVTVEMISGLRISNIKIVSGKKGAIVVMPNYQGQDLIYPIGSDNRRNFNAAILEAYFRMSG